MNNIEQAKESLQVIKKKMKEANYEVNKNLYENAIGIYIECINDIRKISCSDSNVNEGKDTLMAMALYNTGVCFLRSKNPIEAVKYCKEAVKIKPDDGNYNFNTALASFKIYETDDAILYADRAIKIMPNDTQTIKLVELLKRCTTINPVLLELAKL